MSSAKPYLAEIVRSYLTSLNDCFVHLEVEQIERVARALREISVQGRSVFVAGNGGSAATASHMANDLMKTVSFGTGKNMLRVTALTDCVSLLTAYANDVGYESVFANQIAVLANRGDMLILLSASGNSGNLLVAADVAREKGVKIVSFLGMGGGKLLARSDIAIVVDSGDYGAIEDTHLILNHILTKALRTLGE